MEQVEEKLDLERQLHSLRMGLKVVCVMMSLLLIPATWFAIAQCAGTREVVADMGSAAMPGIVRLAFMVADWQILLLIVSLLLFLAVVFCGVRYRNGMFLFVFGLHLLFGGALIVLMTLGSKLSFLKMIQNMQNM